MIFYSFFLLVVAFFLFLAIVRVIQALRFYVRRDTIVLLRYTTKDGAKGIMEANGVFAVKSNYCYFFIKKKNPIKDKRLDHNKLTNADVVVVIEGLTRSQRKSYCVDLRLNVFLHKGNFMFTPKNKVKVYDRATLENCVYRSHRR